MIISAKGMHKHPSHKNSSGFTLIEMLIAIAIISILAAVGIPQYNAYKIRGYDAHTRQALSDIYKLCNAYWIDTNPSEPCDISTIKTPIYGFTQNPDVTSTLSSLSHDKFCASAKHKDSTNAYSIDRAAVISPGNCGSVESRVEEVSLSTPIYDDPPETTPEENLIAEMLAEEFVDLDDPNREYEKISPKVSEVSCETKWANTSYTGSAAFAVDGDPKTKWTCKGMAKIGFDLGQKQVIDAVNVSFEGSVSNGNYVKIYVDGKLVAEGIQGATSKRWDIDNVEGQTVTYETIAQPHNKYNQTATWSEIGEITIEAGDG